MKKNTQILRFFQKKIYSISRKIQFKTSHLSLWSKIALFWLALCSISLFFSWISSYDGILIAGENKIQSVSSFSSMIGSIWYFIFLCIAITMFSILSTESKKKIRAISTIYLPTYLVSLINAVIIFFLSIHSIIAVSGLQKFSVNVIHGNGIVLSITGSIILFIAAWMIKNEETSSLKWSYIHEPSRSESEVVIDKKDNMKLPF